MIAYWCRSCGRKKHANQFLPTNGPRRPVSVNCIKCTVRRMVCGMDRRSAG